MANNNNTDDGYESVLYVCNSIQAFRIPPRSSSRGYRAQDWDNPNAQIWTGRLRIFANSRSASIRLEEPNSGELFALSPIDAKNLAGSVEPVTDSSRYFVIKIVDQASGKHAFIGIGFTERSESFDFNVALQDYVRRETEPQKLAVQKPSVDYTWKEGSSISISLKGAIPLKPKSPPSESTGTNDLPALLPPPPSAKSVSSEVKVDQSEDTDWADFEAAPPAAQSKEKWTKF
ncbi:adaptin ear-binding coat-associated protein 2-like protein [Cladochytrium replicatum]|nr:adaptin ear-binding coat-associated protein 2-like protein [Cladochytrium replicatum]